VLVWQSPAATGRRLWLDPGCCRGYATDKLLLLDDVISTVTSAAGGRRPAIEPGPPGDLCVYFLREQFQPRRPQIAPYCPCKALT
jgi:hypothetical protein